MITCTQFDDLLSDSLASDLPPGARSDFDGHLAACPLCLAVFKNYLRARQMASAAFDRAEETAPPLSEEIVSRVMRAIREQGGASEAARVG